jgi:transmembrane sensor
MMAIRADRPSRTERQAYRWVTRMIDDPQRHEVGLIDWISDDAERLAIYNRAAAAMKAATWSANQLYERRARQPQGPTRVFGSAWAIAVVVVGLAAAIIGIAHLVRPSGQPDVIIPSAQTYDATGSSPRRIELADGSVVTLRPGGHVETRFSRTERRLTLTRGSAEFRVTHAPSWPFIVTAGGGSVTARGTIFEVALGQDVSVKLLEGMVDVTLPARPGLGGPIVRHLTAGSATRFPASQTVADRGALPDKAAPKETGPMKSFDDVPVREVIAEVNRQSAVRIELADPAVGDRRVDLDLHVGDANDVADGLAGYLGLTVDRSRPGLLLLRPTSR